MALIQCKLFSKELFRSVNVNVVLPLPDSNNCFFESVTQFPHDGKKYQVLWLLHGFSADESDWQRFSRIESYAMEKNIAVVMPDGYNSMYADNPWGGNYFSYLTKELPAMLQSFLPLSSKREHNFIAGLSMGGGGAFKAALLNPQQYAAAASLSGGLMPIENIHTPGPVETYSYIWTKNVYGMNNEFFDPAKHDIRTILKAKVAEGAELPRLYQCCGTEDFIYESNITFRNYARSLGVDLTYEEGPGVHNFDFWDPYIRRILNWLPLTGTLVD